MLLHLLLCGHALSLCVDGAPPSGVLALCLSLGVVRVCFPVCYTAPGVAVQGAGPSKPRCFLVWNTVLARDDNDGALGMIPFLCFSLLRSALPLPLSWPSRERAVHSVAAASEMRPKGPAP
jgi:hypothetical protein